MPNQHVVRHPKGWAVKAAGGKRSSSVHPTQAQAVDRATQTARSQGTELIVHGRDGRIREKNSYGNDPFPPRG